MEPPVGPCSHPTPPHGAGEAWRNTRRVTGQRFRLSKGLFTGHRTLAPPTCSPVTKGLYAVVPSTATSCLARKKRQKSVERDRTTIIAGIRHSKEVGITCPGSSGSCGEHPRGCPGESRLPTRGASREMGILRKNQEELLQASLNIITELQSVCCGLIRRVDTAEEGTSAIATVSKPPALKAIPKRV